VSDVLDSLFMERIHPEDRFSFEDDFLGQAMAAITRQLGAVSST